MTRKLQHEIDATRRQIVEIIGSRLITSIQLSEEMKVDISSLSKIMQSMVKRGIIFDVDTLARRGKKSISIYSNTAPMRQKVARQEWFSGLGATTA